MTTRTGPTRLAPHPTTRERVSHLTSTTSYGTQPPIDVSAHVVIPAPWQIQMAPDAEQVRWARGDKQVPYTHRMRPPALYAAKASDRAHLRDARAHDRGPGRSMSRALLSELFELFAIDDAEVGFIGYDGSSAGPGDAKAVIEIRSPLALAYIASLRPDLGLARAYVTGLIEVHVDFVTALRTAATKSRNDVAWRDLAPILRRLAPYALRRPPIPAEEAPSPWRRGRRHSRRRDAVAIAHHYDVSNRFYELLLGSSMAYSCAVFPRAEATLEEAQVEKFDLACRKLDLRPGQRLLDVGGGWGGMIMHAAAHYGVRALGVTISKEQAPYAQRAIAEAGLERRAEMCLVDYRDVRERDFDAISSISAMQHVGTAQLGRHFSSLASCLRPGGRLLNHFVTRPSSRERDRAARFVDRYAFPDAELQSLGTVTGAIHDHGFEVRHGENLREHYAMTLREWSVNLENHWSDAVSAIGERRARVWRLYLAGSMVGVERNRLQVHEVLGVLPTADGRSGTPPRPQWPKQSRDGLTGSAQDREATKRPRARKPSPLDPTAAEYRERGLMRTGSINATVSCERQLAGEARE
jgi:cyclopropane-fatty-acyl-phospholipid synthase